MQWSFYRQCIAIFVLTVCAFVISDHHPAQAQQSEPETASLSAYATEILQRMTMINSWAESTNSMIEAMIQSIGDPEHPEIRSFAADAVDMSWYDLDDSGVIPFLRQYADTLQQLSDDPQNVDKVTPGMESWRQKAKQLEALYTGCLFPQWANAWTLKKPTEVAFDLWMNTPADDPVLSAEVEAQMAAANDAYYAARDKAQSCVNGGKLIELTYDPAF